MISLHTLNTLLLAIAGGCQVFATPSCPIYLPHVSKDGRKTAVFLSHAALKSQGASVVIKWLIFMPTVQTTHEPLNSDNLPFLQILY